MLESHLHKNYSATVCGITMQAVVAKLANIDPRTTGASRIEAL